jgi:hypothetical protein
MYCNTYLCIYVYIYIYIYICIYVAKPIRSRGSRIHIQKHNSAAGYVVISVADRRLTPINGPYCL